MVRVRVEHWARHVCGYCERWQELPGSLKPGQTLHEFGVPSPYIRSGLQNTNMRLSWNEMHSSAVAKRGTRWIGAVMIAMP